MIYEAVDPSAAIRQGDIFNPLPYVVVSLGELRVASPTGTKRRTWKDVSQGPSSALFHVEPTWAIVASQDCDASHRDEVSLFRIEKFEEVTRLAQPNGNAGKKTMKKWVDTLTRKSWLLSRWFYLPRDTDFGFQDRMAVDFCKLLHLSREELEPRRETLRRGRLCKIAHEHFRESIAHFYRRYPYDEWYPLTKEEFEYYRRDKHPGAQPKDWQQ